MADLDLSNPRGIRVEMIRSGLHDLAAWDSPDHGWTDPLDDPEQRQLVKRFLGRLWNAALAAEKAS